MAWQAQVGVPLNLFHPVRDINGALVAGQAASVTVSLLGPDRAAASEVPVLTDFATGWVRVAATLTLTGEYTLKLTNPSHPPADGRVTEYQLFVSAGAVTGAGLLTSRDRVRTRLQLENDAELPITPPDPHIFDSLIDLLISEISDELQRRAGRVFAEATLTEYLDGTGTSSLVLGSGPGVSVTSLESVEYEDDLAGGVTEVRTLIAPHTYVLAGRRAERNYLGLGRIDYLAGTIFTRGPRRWRVVWIAGFDPLPEGIVGLATTFVVARLMQRDTIHLVTQALGDGSINYLRPLQMENLIESTLGLYRLEAA